MRFPTLPILLTTGYSEAAVMAAEERIELLVKPYSIETLADSIARTMESK